ncbi:MAG TPA: autotransporter-associated beta strand repeat-containing protein, partial [Candidatus Binatia bacterium]|nr:autotransporter-associated beta strand repeat-containing protein [Candidatus Binatia bacterium]
NTIHIYGYNNMTINGGIAGAGGLEDDVNGVLMLNGTNSFAGGINLNSGTLQIGGAGLLGGTNGNYGGNITNSGVLQYSSSATQTLSGVVSWYGNMVKDGSGKLILAGNNTYFADTYISNGVLQVAGTLANDSGNDYVYNIVDDGMLQMSGSSVQTLSGIVSGTGNLIMDGSGTLNINNGNNTYSGTTIVNGGTLAYNLNAVSYSTPVNSLVINGGGTVAVTANNGSSLPVGNLTLNTNGVLKLNYDFSGGNPAVAAVAVSGSLSSPGTNVIQINGYGAANTQFPLISYGTLSASLDHFVLSLPPGMSGNLVNNSANHTLDLNVTGTSPSTWIPLTATDGVGTSSFNSAGHWQDGNPPATGNGYYTQGNVLRSPADANAYTFGGSALSIDQYGFGNSGGRFLLKGSGVATLTITNLILNGGLLDYANGGDTGVKTVVGNILLNNGTTSYMGALSGPGYFETLIVAAPISGGGGLQIGGNNINAGADGGVVEMNATNTYGGATTVATGNLLVNGSIGSGSVTVNTNATLGGNGIINGSVTVQAGGTLSPGIPNRGGGALTAAIGTLTVNNAVTLSGSALIKIDRDGATNSDKLVASSVTINPGATLTVNNIGSTNLVAGDTFALFSTPVSGSFSVTNLPALPGPSLAWTNKLAINGTIAVFSTSVGPSGPKVLTNSYNAGAGILSLSWPANEGWRLQVQTNSLSKGLGSNWVYVTDGTVSSTNINVNPTNGSVFYRLTYP